MAKAISIWRGSAAPERFLIDAVAKRGDVESNGLDGAARLVQYWQWR